MVSAPAASWDVTGPLLRTALKCVEHRAGERAAGKLEVVVDDGSGRGHHPYAPKRAEIYLVVFPEYGLLKVGKATPWTVRSRVSDAAGKLRLRKADGESGPAITAKPVAWSIPLFTDENVLWAVSERIEHAAAGRLAYNVAADSVEHTEGKEWLRHDRVGEVEWPTEFSRAVRETCHFLGFDTAKVGKPRAIQ